MIRFDSLKEERLLPFYSGQILDLIYWAYKSLTLDPNSPRFNKKIIITPHQEAYAYNIRREHAKLRGNNLTFFEISVSEK